MSKSSLYEANWINLVFENRNKEYGAYQLRQETTKTSLLALFVSISICALFIVIPKVLESFHLINSQTIEDTTPTLIDPVVVTKVDLKRIIEKEPIIETTAPIVKPQVVTEIAPKQTLSNPTIVHPNDASPDVPKNATMSTTTVDPNATIGTTPTAYSGANTAPGTGTANVNNTSTDYGTAIVSTANLDKQPTFPGGIAKFYNYVGRNFETPEINEEKIVRIMVYFVVEKDGSMTDIQVKNDPGYGLAKEAIRVLKSLKIKWTPGQIESKPVRTAYTLPISVQMN